MSVPGGPGRFWVARSISSPVSAMLNSAARMVPVLVLVCGAAAAVARPDDTPKPVPGYDAETGRDLWAYPPHPLADYGHMKLVIDIPDMNTPRMSAVQTLTLRPVGRALSSLSLDSHLLDVKSVQCAGHKTTFKADGRKLEVTFDPPLETGATAELVTAYSVVDPPAGITWTPESPAWPGRPAQLHSQGQAVTNSYWFPCHDYPNAKLTTELVVTVPAGYTVSSNGRMAEPPKRSGEGAAARETFHWIQDKPHVNYLVSLVVGKFDIVDVAPRGGKLPMPVYVPPGRGQDVAATYGHTARMIELFERRTGQPYPWDRYAQLVVWNFGSGGMENTSATTVYDTAILGPDAVGDDDLDGLISHELAHQWFGDLITCRSWEHIWLNEGFATYFSSLWQEERDGKDGYQAAVLGEFDSVRGSDHAEAPYQRAMVSKAYSSDWEMFGGAANPYSKGSSILHMLRQRLGDEVFFRGLAAYVKEFRFKNAETGDFRRVMENVSGESLDRFFRQWCTRPGVPDLDIGTRWDAAAKELVVTVKQTQKIDGENPAFVFELPVWVDAAARGKVAAGASPNAGTIEVEGKEATARFKLAAEPKMVAIDPEQWVLARMKIDQPVGRWLAQAQGGPTLAARVQAIRGLKSDRTPAATQALVRIAQESGAHQTIRCEAVRALGERKDAQALIGLSSMRLEPSDVRVALAETAGEVGGEKSLESNQAARFKDFLAAAALQDHSGRVRAAAVRSLGKLKATDRAGVVLKAAEAASQHDKVRQAALGALAEMDAPEGLIAAIRYSAPGSFNRTRPVAIGAVQRLAHHDAVSAYKALTAALGDRESRAWRAAGEALVKLGDPRALEELEKLAAGKRDPQDVKTVRGWVEELKKATEAKKKP